MGHGHSPNGRSEDPDDESFLETRRKFLTYGALATGVAVAGCTGGGGGEVTEGNYPSEEVRWIIPYGQGGGSDTIGRQVGGFLTDHFDVNVGFENLTGGIRHERECYNEEDPYLVCQTSLPGRNLTLRAQGADFSMNEFKFAMHYSGVKFHLGVHADEEVEDAQEYLQRLKGDEWETMGTNEQSQIDLLAPYLLEDEAYEGGPKVGEDYRLVPYSGGGEMRPALLNREVDCSWAVGTWIAEEDSLESVACVAPERDPVLPDVPTLQEQGYPPLGPVVTARHALMFNPGVPDFVPRAWADAWAEVIDQDEVQEWSEESGNWLVNVGPQEMQDMVSEMEELIDEYARVPQ